MGVSRGVVQLVSPVKSCEAHLMKNQTTVSRPWTDMAMMYICYPGREAATGVQGEKQRRKADSAKREVQEVCLLTITGIVQGNTGSSFFVLLQSASQEYDTSQCSHRLRHYSVIS